MCSREELARDLHLLAVALHADPERNPDALRQAAARLRSELPASAADKDQLARQLRLPRSLLEPWLVDTLDLLDADQACAPVREQAIERMSALAWAWGEVPENWPPQLEAATKGTWGEWRDER
jgi:hypothetical protein